MNDKINAILIQLRKLDKAYTKMRSGSHSLSTAMKLADERFRELLSMLEDPDVVKAVELHIAKARDQIATEDFDNELRNRRNDVAFVELRLAQPFGLRRKDLEGMFETYFESKGEKDKFITNIGELREQLAESHSTMKAEMIRIRESAQNMTPKKKIPRKKKKTIKRNIGLGIASTMYGTVVIASNLLFPMGFSASYALGASALHTAFRDFVGTKD